MSFILTNWKSIGAVLAALGVAYMAHALDINRIEENHREEFAAQAKVLDAECAKEKAITEEVANDYQNQLTTLTDDYNALRVQYDGSVKIKSTDAASCNYEGSPSGQLSSEDGIPAQELIDLARDAEEVRVRLIGCQSFIKKTWTLE